MKNLKGWDGSTDITDSTRIFTDVFVNCYAIFPWNGIDIRSKLSIPQKQPARAGDMFVAICKSTRQQNPPVRCDMFVDKNRIINLTKENPDEK